MKRITGLSALCLCMVSPIAGGSLVRRPPSLNSLELPPAYSPASVLPQETGSPDPPPTFKRLCTPCHGEKGKGNGPAAVAFNPPPADLTDPEGVGKRTDAELREVLTGGKASMPAFGTVLKPAQIDSLVSYIRKLSGSTEGEAARGSGAGTTSEM